MPAPKHPIPVVKIQELAQTTAEFSKALTDFAEQVKAKHSEELRITGWKRIVSSLQQAKESLSAITGQAHDLAAIDFLKCLPEGETVFRRNAAPDAGKIEVEVKARRTQKKK